MGTGGDREGGVNLRDLPEEIKVSQAGVNEFERRFGSSVSGLMKGRNSVRVASEAPDVHRGYRGWKGGEHGKVRKDHNISTL